MNKYEAMFIFPESIKDSALEETLGTVKAEIKKLGGEVDSATRLGKRAFSRPMKKQEAGQYALVAFRAGGDIIPQLLARYKLDEDVFRVQIVRAPAKPPAPVKKREESDDGIA